MEESGPPSLVCPPTARVHPVATSPDRTSDQLPRRSQNRRSDIGRLDAGCGRDRSVGNECSAACAALGIRQFR